jgi:hypothetical protein
VRFEGEAQPGQSLTQVGPRQLYRLAKQRWTIENEGFNDAKTRYGLSPVPHHDGSSLECYWLLVALVLTLERLFRLRFLRRGAYAPRSAIDLFRCQRLSLAAPRLNSTWPGPPRDPGVFARPGTPRAGRTSAGRPVVKSYATRGFRKSCRADAGLDGSPAHG